MPKEERCNRLRDSITIYWMGVLDLIRYSPNDRLILQPPRRARAPVWQKKADYDVCYRGQVVGRIWRHSYEEGEGKDYAWHWHVRATREQDWRHAFTLQEAMDQFRNAWDSLLPNEETRTI